MELDGLQVPDLFVSNAHDGPIIGPGSHLQVLWTGGLLHNQTVITCRHEWTGPKVDPGRFATVEWLPLAAR